MNQQIVSIAIPAVLTLLGTAVGLWLGHWRWSSELRMKKRQAFDARRYEAYQDLWKLLEEAHIQLRLREPPTPDDIVRLDSTLNHFRLRNTIFLDSTDAELSN